MKIKSKFVATLGSLGMLLSVNCQAALFDRGGGLIYDDVLDATWLQNPADLYSSHGREIGDGGISFASAQSWASSFSYYDSERNTTYSDWRLPHAYGLDWQTAVDTNSPLTGAPATPSQNELAYMYYVNLGFDANPLPPGVEPGSYDLPTTTYSEEDFYNPFGDNIIYRGMWTDGVVADEGGPDNSVWYFHFHFGESLVSRSALDSNDPDLQHVWLLRNGDVSPVPVPPALLLMGSGMLLLGFMNKKRKALAA
ncbi:MAG: hypothetical protein P8101_01165 [Candidatus Thiodiazotropha sp.]